MEKSRPLLLICYAFGTFACSCSMVLFSLFFLFPFIFLYSRGGLLGFSPSVSFFFFSYFFVELGL
ncbi:hypothetical protein B9Z19DRAFT_1079560 [Tuber borchii]|uniref:Uncharacterized protein n=1 Tax=Tuber borchii TaxID=42251 RepID=A0A2T6ZY08_TUBBO|nr:hypothetical protein B9Z19DRAFT_1079560 [Tuber borchii]